MPRRLALLLAFPALLLATEDWEQQVRALRPAGNKAQATAVLDELEQRARRALDAIPHAATPAQAAASRPLLRQKLEASLGFRRLPWPPRLQPQVIDVVQRNGYRIEKIVWQTLPGTLVPAHLYVPDIQSGPFPAVLVYVGHWWPDAKTRPDFQAFCINMARFGFVVLIWDPFGQGERGISSRDHRRIETLLVGVSQQGIAEYETRCALEYLLSRKEVDKNRIGMTGASGGGYNTWITAALDDRIKVAVPVVGTSEFANQIHASRAFDWYHASDHCHFVPGLLHYANNQEFVSMIAPRPLLIVAASEDKSFPIAGVRQIAAYAGGLYKAYEAPEKTAFFEDTRDGHGYQQKKREAAYGWFQKWLRNVGDGGPYLEPTTQTFPFDSPELQCFPPEQNPPAGPGIVDAVRHLATRKDRVPTAPITVLTSPARPRDTRLQRLAIPVSGGFEAPAFLLRPSGKQRGIVLALDDRGKEATLADPAIREAFARGWAICGFDPRGIGELATTQTGWVAAVSLLLDEPFTDRQAGDILAAASVAARQPLALFARGQNTALAAARVIAVLPNLTWYILRDTFLSYHQFLDRPESLPLSFRLRDNTNNPLTTFDREIPFLYVPFNALRHPDLPERMPRHGVRALIVDPLNGDWGRLEESAARKLLPASVRVISSDDPSAAEQAFVRSLN
ncbi:MAG TPA: prolyl oligopeptidase family serine peptidase [Bryobacteraceae bacterium]|jgi:dienelactone hydrolase|nr:prolyl oligopeptidase family serine peptidase [Bryobacteraceae bacterium]